MFYYIFIANIIQIYKLSKIFDRCFIYCPSKNSINIWNCIFLPYFLLELTLVCYSDNGSYFFVLHFQQVLSYLSNQVYQYLFVTNNLHFQCLVHRKPLLQNHISYQAQLKHHTSFFFLPKVHETFHTVKANHSL